MRLTLLLLAIALSLALPLSSAHAAMFKDVPTDSWEYSTMDELKAVDLVRGIPEFYPRRTFVRYEMAMLTGVIYDKLHNEGGADRLSPELALRTFALAAEYEPELEKMRINIEDLMNDALMLAAQRIIPTMSQPIQGSRRGLFEEIPRNSWADAFLIDLIEAKVSTGILDAYRGPNRRSFLRYEAASMVAGTFSNHISNQSKYSLSLSNRLKLMALIQELAPELLELGHGPIIMFRYLAEHQEFQEVENGS